MKEGAASDRRPLFRGRCVRDDDLARRDRADRPKADLPGARYGREADRQKAPNLADRGVLFGPRFQAATPRRWTMMVAAPASSKPSRIIAHSDTVGTGAGVT